MAAIADRVRNFVVHDLNWSGDPAQLTEDFPLIDERVVDSLGLLGMVSFLESEFGISVDDTEITPTHFGTLGSIERYVADKRG
ncbi:acyl carrier protein [Micromonospora sp. NPDC047074]|uniref:acyl carrier protein n=1 Tax=Micromonospora sp. NPDC047074 TaxID=3154339 RepID=UPI00340C148D